MLATLNHRNVVRYHTCWIESSVITHASNKICDKETKESRILDEYCDENYDKFYAFKWNCVNTV